MKTAEQRNQLYEGLGRSVALMMASSVQAIHDGALQAIHQRGLSGRSRDDNSLLQISMGRGGFVSGVPGVLPREGAPRPRNLNHLQVPRRYDYLPKSASGPTCHNLMAFGTYSLNIWVPEPLGSCSHSMVYAQNLNRAVQA